MGEYYGLLFQRLFYLSVNAHACMLTEAMSRHGFREDMATL